MRLNSEKIREYIEAFMVADVFIVLCVVVISAVSSQLVKKLI